MRGRIVLALAPIALLAVGSALAAPLTGKVQVYIEPTNLIIGLVRPDVGLNGRPEHDSSEVRDAFAQFADPEAAKRALEALKAAKGYQGGLVFAGFHFQAEGQFGGEAQLLCGVTPEESGDWSKIRARMTDYSTDPSKLGTYTAFKDAPREQRVRAIARCLRDLPGMPALKPTRPEIRHLHIDERSYALATRWLKKHDAQGIQGTDEQYRKAFRCLISRAARELPEAVGDSVVVRSIRVTGRTPAPDRNSLNAGQHKRKKKRITFTAITVADASQVEDIFDADDLRELEGMWPLRVGADAMSTEERPDVMHQILRESIRHVPDCRRKAGLFEVPVADVNRMLEGGKTTCVR